MKGPASAVDALDTTCSCLPLCTCSRGLQHAHVMGTKQHSSHPCGGSFWLHIPQTMHSNQAVQHSSHEIVEVSLLLHA